MKDEHRILGNLDTESMMDIIETVLLTESKLRFKEELTNEETMEIEGRLYDLFNKEKNKYNKNRNIRRFEWLQKNGHLNRLWHTLNEPKTPKSKNTG